MPAEATRFALTLAAGGILGIVFMRLKIPSGLRIGAFLGTAALSVLSALAWTPPVTRHLVQCVAGALIGCTMEKSDVRRLPGIIKPTVIQLGSFLVLNILGGVLVHAVSPLNWATCFMSVVPGGVTDTPIIAADMGADAALVAVLQLARLILGISVFPSMIFAYDNRCVKADARRGLVEKEAPVSAGSTIKRVTSKNKSPLSFVLTLAVACGFGYLGYRTHIPAGSFLFAIIAVLLLKVIFDFAYMPPLAKKGANLLSGCYIGTNVTVATLAYLKYLALPLVIILGLFIANAFVTGRILSRTCGFSRKEGMLITTPAGASDIALNSGDIGVNNTDIIVIQIFRAVVALAVFPQIINIILMRLAH